MSNTRLLAAVNKTVKSTSSVFSAIEVTQRLSFAAHPMTQAELTEISRAAGISEFKMLTTISGLASQISQRPKWRSAQIVLVDAITIDDNRGIGPIDQPLPIFDRIREERLAEDQPKRTVIGLIPHSKVAQTDRDYLLNSGVDLVCTPEELKTIIPTILAA